MLRVILVQILLFVLPFVAFAFYVYFTHGRADHAEAWRGRYVWIAFAGFFLAMVGLFATVLYGAGGTQDVYVPAEVIDGVIQPGRLVAPDSGGE